MLKKKIFTKKLLFAILGSLLFVTMAFVLAASPPIISGITIAPSPANTTDALNCSAAAYDLDLDAMTINLTWYNGSTYYNSSTFSTTNGTLKTLNLTAGIQASGETWNCTIFANDGTADSLLNSTKITIASVGPTIDAIAIKPTTAYTNSTLNCSGTYGDIDADKSNITFSWYNGSTLYWQTTQFNKMNGETLNEPLTWYNKTGLVAYYKFSEGNGTQVRDISGNESNGTLKNFDFNASSGWVQGKYGNGLLFGGGTGDDYVMTNLSSSLLKENFTAMGWFKADSFNAVVSVGNRLLTSWRVAASSRWAIGATNGKFSLYTYTTSASTTDGSALTAGTWYHFAIVYNGLNIKAYLNGSQDINVDGTLTTGTNDNVRIGIYNEGSSGSDRRPWDGTIDEVMIFNRSLSATEIQEIYSASPQAKGETWNCTINATDATGLSGTPVSSIATISPCEDTVAKICNVDCSKNYNIQTPIDLGGNYLFIIGSGTFTSNSNMKNQGMTFISGGCDVRNL